MARQRKATTSWKDRHPRTVFTSLLCMAGVIVGVSVFLLLRSNGEPTPKKDLAVRDSLDVFLDNIHPNDFSRSILPVEPLPPPLVVVSKETKYLAKFVGPYIKVTTKPGEQKSKSQIFFEQLLTDFPRDQASGKWIDNLPDTKPLSQSDIAPRLPANILYNDRSAANAHWDAFQKRNPRTTAILKKYIERPIVQWMPGEDMQSFSKFWWKRDRENHYPRGRDLLDCKPEDENRFWMGLGERLLYADFLIARGDDVAKEHAHQLLLQSYRSLNDQEYYRKKERLWTVAVGAEIVWPNLDWQKDRYDHADIVFLIDGVECQYGNPHYQKTAEFLRICKWGIAHTNLEINQLTTFDKCRKELQFSHLLHGYGLAGDTVGILLCHYASRSYEGHNKSSLRSVKKMLINLYGPTVGATKYQRYVEMLSK